MFNKPKTSLAKYLIEFNDLADEVRPHGIMYLNLFSKLCTFMYVEKSVGADYQKVSLLFLNSITETLKSKIRNEI